MSATHRHTIISVWSDYVCPFCYLEEPILDKLRQEQGNRLQIEWRAYELRPDPVPTLDPNGEYLRSTWARVVYPMAQQRGMVLRLPPVQPRSRKALEAAEFARDQDCFERLHHALFQAFFEHGQDIGSISVLLAIGEAVGLNPLELRQALEEEHYTQRVLEDEQLAHDLAITAVPTLLIRRSDQSLSEARHLSGAQPYETLYAVVQALYSSL